MFSDYVQPICLPLPSEAAMTGDPLIVAGWGITEYGFQSTVKRSVQVLESNIGRCANLYGGQIPYSITDNQLCAEGKEEKGACKGM